MEDATAPALDDFERHKPIIIAAVAAVCGSAAEIRSIRPASTWTREGRLRIHSRDISRRRGGGFRPQLPDRGGPA